MGRHAVIGLVRVVLFGVTVIGSGCCGGRGVAPVPTSNTSDRDDRDGDLDGDGVVDAADLCRSQAEDLDGCYDQDGCPDLDDDEDGVPDAIDRCPGTRGVAAESGCVAIVAGRVVVYAGHAAGDFILLQPVYFDRDKPEPRVAGDGILDELAEYVRLSPALLRLNIIGHTDHREPAELALTRAETVRRSLISRGLGPRAGRLHVAGRGATEPARPATEDGPPHNRRVTFTVQSMTCDR